IRDRNVTGVQTCALPISRQHRLHAAQLPLTVTLSAWPLLELGGMKSMLPSSEPWSESRLVGNPGVVTGIPKPWRMPSRRVTESRSEERRVGKEGGAGQWR